MDKSHEAIKLLLAQMAAMREDVMTMQESLADLSRLYGRLRGDLHILRRDLLNLDMHLSNKLDRIESYLNIPD